MRPEGWITIAICALVCIPIVFIQSVKFVRNLPRARDRSLPAAERIDAQNVVFGAIVGIPLSLWGVVATTWLAVHEFLGH